jgi:hypothetical protein
MAPTAGTANTAGLQRRPVEIAAELSFSMTSLDVAFGTHKPYQTEIYNPSAPASSTVGMSGAEGSRLLAVTA